ncbi:MAG: glycosyltransferase [Ignavibacteriales bacterium CG12_big_fil_rev_8_21_14_0_65_30_8]|nr:MAG: glycosyltransferase [Ignavibacteriales bacterium CG12_big_fil_rev_8_21_14_0_65_30_8]
MKQPYNRKRRYYKYRRPYKPTVNISFKKLSIIIPLIDEEESIKPLVSAIHRSLLNKRIQYEIIFIDDGSKDNSLKIIKELNTQNKNIKYFSFQKNYGKSAALQVGFINATGHAIITMDADLQDDPAEILNLLKKLDEGYDLVSGWKKKRQDPFIKKISSRFFNFITRILTGIKIHDFNCGLKAYRNDVVKNIRVYGELHRYVPVLARWQGYKVSEIVVKHHPRRYGKTKFGISRFFKGFIDLITVLFATRYIKRPMHFFGFLGAFAFFIGIIVNGYLTYQWIIGIPLSNRPMLFLGILLIIVGVQFFSIGLLGEILVHNSMDEKEYLIKDKG